LPRIPNPMTGRICLGSVILLVGMAQSGFTTSYEADFDAESKAKSVTNNLHILYVLATV
jgi:hypothetical protein